MVTDCACGIGSIFGSPGYIPHCAPGLRAAHNLAYSPTAVSIQQSANTHTHTLFSKIKKRRPVNTASIVKLIFWAYLPSGNSTCVKGMDRHRSGAEHCCSSSAILPGHNRVAPVKRPSRASHQWLSRAAGSRRARQRRSRPIPAERPSGDPSSIENNYWMKKKSSGHHIKSK